MILLLLFSGNYMTITIYVYCHNYDIANVFRCSGTKILMALGTKKERRKSNGFYRLYRHGDVTNAAFVEEAKEASCFVHQLCLPSKGAL